MGCCNSTKVWPTLENDGWFMAHNVIRNDIEDTLLALKQLELWCNNKSKNNRYIIKRSRIMDVRLHREMVGFSRIKYSSPSRKRGKISFPLH